MKYQVFDSGKPADSKSQNLKKGIGWDNSIFDTEQEARDYAADYFSFYIVGLEIELNKPLYYYGGQPGPSAEIREIKSDKEQAIDQLISEILNFPKKTPNWADIAKFQALARACL